MSGSLPSMIEYDDDLANQEAPPCLPDGIYPGEIVSAAIRLSTNTGNNYLQLGIRFAPEVYPPDFADGDPDGTVVMYNRLIVSKKGRDRWLMKLHMEAIGGPTGKTIDPNELLGLTGMFEINSREYQGEKQNNIVRFVKP